MTTVASGRCMRIKSVLRKLYFGNRAATRSQRLPVDELGDSGFNVGLELLHLVPHGCSPLILGLAVALWTATPLRRCLTAPARRGGAGSRWSARSAARTNDLDAV